MHKRHPEDMEAHKKTRLERKSALACLAAMDASELTLLNLPQNNRDEMTPHGGRSSQRKPPQSRVRLASKSIVSWG